MNIDILVQIKKDSFEIFKQHLWRLKKIVSDHYPESSNDDQWDEAIKLSAGMAVKHHNILSELIGKDGDIIGERETPKKETLNVSVDDFLEGLGFKVEGENGSEA